MTRKQEIREYIEQKGIVAVIKVLNEICQDKVADCKLFGGYTDDRWQPFWEIGMEATTKMLNLFNQRTPRGV
jgi:hypothetical protein